MSLFLNLKITESVMNVPEQIENRMLIDSEWEGIEHLQMRTSDRHSRRLQQIIDEIEYGKLEERD